MPEAGAGEARGVGVCGRIAGRSCSPARPTEALRDRGRTCHCCCSAIARPPLRDGGAINPQKRTGRLAVRELHDTCRRASVPGVQPAGLLKTCNRHCCPGAAETVTRIVPDAVSTRPEIEPGSRAAISISTLMPAWTFAACRLRRRSCLSGRWLSLSKNSTRLGGAVVAFGHPPLPPGQAGDPTPGL